MISRAARAGAVAIPVLGVLQSLAIAANTLLSPVLARGLPFERPSPGVPAFLEHAARELPVLAPALRAALAAGGGLTRPLAAALAFGPACLSAAVFVALVVWLARRAPSLDASVPVRLARWWWVFGGLAVLALPWQAFDLWLSVGWGRIAWSGANPYHAAFPTPVPPDLPVASGMRMTYGPLWALVSAASAGLTGGNALAGAVLLKLVLLGAWGGVLALVQRMVHERPVWHRAWAVAVVAWLPLPVLVGIAEGHNDVFGAALALLWLARLERAQRVRASLLLAASVAVKYLTAPLFLLDVLDAWRSGGRRWWRTWAPGALAAGALLAVLFALFVRGPEFFEPLAQIRYELYRPMDAFLLPRSLGLPLGGLADGWELALVFGGIALLGVARWLRAPDAELRRRAALAVACGILFAALPQVFPWYLIWALPLAALVPGSWLARWVVGFSLLAVFLVPALDVLHGLANRWTLHVPTTAAYVLSLVWLVLSGRLQPGPAAAAQNSRVRPLAHTATASR